MDGNEALCNEAPYSHELNPGFSGIRTRDLLIEVGSTNHSASRTLYQNPGQSALAGLDILLDWLQSRVIKYFSYNPVW